MRKLSFLLSSLLLLACVTTTGERLILSRSVILAGSTTELTLTAPPTSCLQEILVEWGDGENSRWGEDRLTSCMRVYRKDHFYKRSAQYLITVQFRVHGSSKTYLLTRNMIVG